MAVWIAYHKLLGPFTDLSIAVCYVTRMFLLELVVVRLRVCVKDGCGSLDD